MVSLPTQFLPLLTSAPATYSAVALSRGTWVPQPMARTPLLSRSPPTSTGRRTPDIHELIVLGDKGPALIIHLEHAARRRNISSASSHCSCSSRAQERIERCYLTSRFPDVRTYHDARFLAVAFDADPAIQQSPYCKV